MQTNNHHWANFWHIQTTFEWNSFALATGHRREKAQFSVMERWTTSWKYAHKKISIVKVMRFSLNLASSIAHMAFPTLRVNIQYACKKCQSIYIFDWTNVLQRWKCLAFEWKKYFRQEKKKFSYEAIWIWKEDRWMDGWADFISFKNVNISGIKLFEIMIPYVDPLFISQLKNNLFARIKSAIRKKMHAV